MTEEESRDMDFSKALSFMKYGLSARRASWKGGLEWIKVKDIEMGIPCDLKNKFLYRFTTNGDFVMWNPSHQDLFAEDWRII